MFYYSMLDWSQQHFLKRMRVTFQEQIPGTKVPDRYLVYFKECNEGFKTFNYANNCQTSYICKLWNNNRIYVLSR